MRRVIIYLIFMLISSVHIISYSSDLDIKLPSEIGDFSQESSQQERSMESNSSSNSSQPEDDLEYHWWENECTRIKKYYDKYGKVEGYNGKTAAEVLQILQNEKKSLEDTLVTVEAAKPWDDLIKIAKEETNNATNESTSEEDFMNYTYDQIIDYMNTWSSGTKFPLSEKIRQKWKDTLTNTSSTASDAYARNNLKEYYLYKLDNNNVPPSNDDYKKEYSTGVLGNSDSSAEHTMDDVVQNAQNFLNQGASTIPINGDNLKKGSSTLYNILLSIGIFLAVAIGMYLGVKFMLSTAEDKAKVKEALVPYIAGCVVIFTAFTLWKVAILLLGGIS